MKTIVITGSTRGIGFGLALNRLSLGCIFDREVSFACLGVVKVISVIFNFHFSLQSLIFKPKVVRFFNDLIFKLK